jgi:hypothetical protein
MIWLHSRGSYRGRLQRIFFFLRHVMAAKVCLGSNQEGPLVNAFAIAGEIAFPAAAGEGVVAAAADEE